MDVTQVKKEDDKKEKTEEEVVHLRREIGLLPAVCFIIGTVVGSGIFIAPKGVLINSGSVGLSLLVWALCGVLSLFGALCYAELGTSFTKSGGHYTYLLETLGPLPAFLRLWAEFFFIRPSVASYVSLAFGRYVVEPFYAPCDAPTVLIKLVSILGLTFVVAVNCWRKTENFQNGFEVESITLDRLPLAFYNGLYAYGGWFYLNFVTEEVINPNRNIPLAIICSMVMTFANRALQGMASVIPFLVALSCLGALNGGFFGAPRMLFVGAREGHWPPIFSMIHIRRHTPLPAVLLLYPMVVVVMLMTGEIYQLINFASFSRWFFIALATLGMLIHRYRFPLHPRPFKVPLVIAVTFTVVCFFIVGLSLYSDPWNTGISCALTLTGVPVYYLTVYRYRLPHSWRCFFDYLSKQLQILLEVSQQEVRTY
ncbi:Cystine/glutamate transporter [Dissostichus eleginoides]|uniref:Cystine/glutamate transporter n=1 Tax=Dissostichus eleginoides TaxID=100907 RepID=A0AAD9FPJ3_DISEL|nr:Cystine/glutamate transporter [Dissostichus eleginoides]